MTIEATLERIATALETIAKNTTPITYPGDVHLTVPEPLKVSPNTIKAVIATVEKAAAAETVAQKQEPTKVELKIVEDEPTKAEPQKVAAPTNVTRQQFMAKFQELYSDAAPNRGRNACVAILGKVGVGKASEIKDEQLAQAQELVLAALAA